MILFSMIDFKKRLLIFFDIQLFLKSQYGILFFQNNATPLLRFVFQTRGSRSNAWSF